MASEQLEEALDGFGGAGDALGGFGEARGTHGSLWRWLSELALALALAEPTEAMVGFG